MGFPINYGDASRTKIRTAYICPNRVDEQVDDYIASFFHDESTKIPHSVKMHTPHQLEVNCIFPAQRGALHEGSFSTVAVRYQY